MGLMEEHIEFIGEHEIHYAESKFNNDVIEISPIFDKLNQKYFDLYNSAPFGYFILDKNGTIVELNNAGAELLDFQKTTLLKENFRDFVSLKCRDLFFNALKHALESRFKQSFELELVRTDGKTFWAKVEIIFRPDDDQFGMALMDINEVIETEKELRKSLKEKEMLIREVNHRVKNNMQIISSLLSLQSRYLDEEVLDVYKESQNRVRTMALVHEKLHQSKDLKSVNLAEYIKNLVYNLSSSYGTHSIEFKIDVDPISLDSDTVIPLGLIINEIVTNSIKYAFEDDEGIIKIEFHSMGAKFKLTIEDNGIGLPENIDLENTDSLGLKLINSLSGQINADINIYRDNGTKFEIIF
ncbi:MAG TPA: histidine kinase dimerization/phosphoacceptor domain -containing protein [Methanobacterium sp.]|nr:histidine kinase dimerization/phosphoacceptor domain -containing protein [Methanobacterium sp.]